MFFKSTVNGLAILAVLILHLAVTSLPAGLSFITLAPVVMVLVLVLFGLRLSVVWALALGLSLDLLSFGLAGSHFVGLLLALLVSYLLLVNVLTDRSLYSLMLLSGTASAIYLFVLWLAGVLIGDGWRWYWWLHLWKFLVANLLLTAVLFYLSGLLSKRIQPVFLRQFKKY